MEPQPSPRQPHNQSSRSADEGTGLTEPVFGQRVLGGAIIMTLASWAGKGAKFATIVLLARLLTLEEFGIAAALGVMIALQTLIDTLGFQSALIQQQTEPTHDELNTAWTLDNLSTRLLMGLLYLVGGSWIASWFGLETSTQTVQLIAVVAFVRALESPAIVTLLRRLDYSKRAALPMAESLVTAAVVLMLLAIGERSGSIVVIGAISGAGARTLTSYIVCPHIPRPRLNRPMLRLRYSFGAWLFCLQIARRIRMSLDRVLLGTMGGAIPLGVYQIGSGLFQELTSDINRTSTAVVFPAIAKIQHHTHRVQAALFRTLELTSLVTIVACGLAFVHASPIITTVFGDKWITAEPILQIVAIATILRGTMTVVDPVLRGLGRSDLEFLLQFAMIPTLALAGLLLIPSLGARGLAVAVLVAEIILVPLSLVALRRALEVSPRQILSAVRPGAVLGGLTVAASYTLIVCTGSPDSIPSLLIHLALPLAGLGLAIGLFGERALPRNGETIRAGIDRIRGRIRGQEANLEAWSGTTPGPPDL